MVNPGTENLKVKAEPNVTVAAFESLQKSIEAIKIKVDELQSSGGICTTQVQKSKTEQTLKCDFCNRTGHDISKCWRRLGYCLICGAPDHFRAQCPKRRINQRGNNQNQRVLPNNYERGPYHQQYEREQLQMASSANNQIYCLYCGDQGHVMRNCQNYLTEIRLPSNYNPNQTNLN